MIPRTVLDTDILSSLMRRHQSVVERSREYLSEHSHISISVITRYEILRGLKARSQSKALDTFAEFSRTCEVLPLADKVVNAAADIYADLYRRGQLIGDADILIAATAISGDYVLATNNQTHFSRITGLRIDNWLS